MPLSFTVCHLRFYGERIRGSSFGNTQVQRFLPAILLSAWVSWPLRSHAFWISGSFTSSSVTEAPTTLQKPGNLCGPCPAHMLVRDLEKAPVTAGTSRPVGPGPQKLGLTLLCVAGMVHQARMCLALAGHMKLGTRGVPPGNVTRVSGALNSAWEQEGAAEGM